MTSRLEHDPTVVLSLERTQATAVVVNYTFPLTSYLAAAIALSGLDGRTALDFVQQDPERAVKVIPERSEMISYVTGSSLASGVNQW